MENDISNKTSIRKLLNHALGWDSRLEHAREANEPEVGIFWDVDGKLIIHGIPVTKSEPYGRFRNYPGAHEQRWQMLQQIGAVSRDIEYDHPARGRVVWDTLSHRALLYADRCILRDEAMLDRIREELRLPENTEINVDEHYSCRAVCLRGTSEEE